MNDPSALEAASDLFASTEILSNIDRLAIYRDNVNAGFINTLKTTYPACHKLVGDEFFSAMCYRYLQNTRSTSPDLNNYGNDFPDFIADFPHAQELPYLSDVAKLEWLWHRCHFFKKNKIADFKHLSSVSENELSQCVFKLAHDAVFITSEYPIFEIWEANVFDGAGEKTIDLNSSGSQLIIFRNHDGRHADRLNEAQYFLLQTIEQQLTFGMLSEQYINKGFGMSFEKTFISCCSNGWISGQNTARPRFVPI